MVGSLPVLWLMLVIVTLISSMDEDTAYIILPLAVRLLITELFKPTVDSVEADKNKSLL